MGVSGCGKTTVGSLLSKRTGFIFYDGDDYHPKPNIRKMTRGEPLTETDRASWVLRIIELINTNKNESKIIACSALTKSIRNSIREGAKDGCEFVFLKGNYGLIERRIKSRDNHFMKAGLLTSQFETLEEPTNALTIDIEHPPGQICELIVNSIFTNHE